MSGNRKPGRARRPALSAAQIRGAPQSGRILPLRTCCRLELMCAFPPPKQARCRTLVFLVTHGSTTYRLQVWHNTRVPTSGAALPSLVAEWPERVDFGGLGTAGERPLSYPVRSLPLIST